MDARIPVRLEDFTAEFVSEALAADGSPANVSSVRVERIGTGDGFLGDVGRLHLDYAGPDDLGPSTLVAKIPTSDEGLKPLGVMLGVYEREARFYDELAKDLQIGLPRCYYNAWDTDVDGYALLLEDVSHLTAGDQAAGASLEQAVAALRAAAGVHSRWWKNPTITESDWVPKIDDPLNLGLQDLFAASFPTVVDLFGDRLGPRLVSTIEEFIPTTADFLRSYGDISVTLVHNDFRLDNMFFGSDLTLIDWQIIGCGDGSGDFVPFLAVNLDTELRRAREEDLLAGYLDVMHEHEAGYPDLDSLMTGYRGGLLFWLATWMNTVATAGRPNERAVALMECVVDRLAAAALDHEVWEFQGDYTFHPSL